MPKLKEPHYFAKFDDDACRNKFFFIRDWDEYLRLFDGAKIQKAIGESSVSYLCHRGTAERIRAKVPDARIIIALRNPVERLFSHFMMDIRDGKIPQNSSILPTVFEDAKVLEKVWGQCNLYLECGLYAEQVAEYLRTFGEERVKVIIYERFRAQPDTIITEIHDYLGVDSRFMPSLGESYNIYAKPRSSLLAAIYSSYRIRRIGKLVFPDRWKRVILHMFLKRVEKPLMTDAESAVLRDFYREDVQALGTLLNKDLSIWGC